MKVIRNISIVFILFLILTPTLFSPAKPVLSYSQVVVNLIIRGDPKEAEQFVKSRYHLADRVTSAPNILSFLHHLQDLGVESFNIQASSPTDATIFLETKSKTKKAFLLKIENNAPYIIKSFQEIPLNFSESVGYKEQD